MKFSRRVAPIAQRARFAGLLVHGLALAAVALLAASARAADIHNPFAGDSKAAQAGEFEFRINCAFCHGLGARGGGRGPDLTRAHRRHGDSDSDMIINYLRSIQVKAPAKPVGNAAHGKELFYGDGNCSSCHMIEGKGGRLGPDLSSVGTSRTIESIKESIRNPSQRLAWGLTEPTKEFAQEYETVTVVTADGKQIKGVILDEDQFSLQMMDTTERIHLFEKDKLHSISKSRQSLMPAYNATILGDSDLQDIVAYLLSVGME